MVAARKAEDDAERIWTVLETVADPEIPVLSVVDLGIVREVDACAGRISITPTYTGCPATQVIERDIRTALDSAGLRDIKVETTLSPPWTTEWISEAGKAKLRAYGIAPPGLRRDGSPRTPTSRSAARPRPCRCSTGGSSLPISDRGSRSA